MNEPAAGGRHGEPMVGVIGGTGLYALLDGVDEVEVETPYGPPSSPISIGSVDGHRVAFLPRHGRGHTFIPSAVPYRANIWALRSLGVDHVLAPFAAGSLRPDLGPGDLVVPDQLIDRTHGRASTFFDGSVSYHASFAEPYCATLREAVLAACREVGVEARDGGTVVVINGPRFSTRAEARWHASIGGDLVNMTQMPEAVLAAEAGLGYAALALVTDRDAGIERADDGGPGDAAVTEAAVYEVFEANLQRVREVVLATARSPITSCDHDGGPWPDDRG